MRPRLHHLVALALVAATASITTAAATTQRTVAVSPTASSATWDGPTVLASNTNYEPASGSPCGSSETDFCDATILRVDVAESFWKTTSGGVRIGVCTPACDERGPRNLANFDVYVYRSDDAGTRGPLVASSARPLSNEDEIVRIPFASGHYLVHVVYAQMLEPSSYRAAVSLVKGPILGAEQMGLRCESKMSKDEPPIHFTSCTGFVRSFDGHPLFVDVSVPDGASARLPTLVMLHGFTGNGGLLRSDTVEGCFVANGAPQCTAGLYHYNRTWFVSKGYAVITYSARGHGSSCGSDSEPPAPPDQCGRGWAHISHRDFEVRDSQHVLGLAVDSGISDPDRLGATGGSYGAAQTWTLALSEPWATAKNQRLQLAAAVPFYGWTDLLGALMPNGRATDGLDQSASHHSPIGVWKQSLTELHLAVARSGNWGPGHTFCLPSCPPSPVRLNDVDPTELHSHTNGWLAFWRAGEPYDTPIGGAMAEAFRGNSAYFAADGYLRQLEAGSARRVPIYAVSGWTDAFFPVVETVQMYRRLKAADPGYPISVALADAGHAAAQNPEGQVRYLNEQATKFLDAHVLRPEERPTPPAAASFASQCPVSSAVTPDITASSWDHLQGAAVVLGAGGSRTSFSSPPDADEVAADPVVRQAGCITQLDGAQKAEKVWSWPVAKKSVTLLGLPTVRVGYATGATDVTLVAKLWDAAPDGSRTLVTRGLYRLSRTATSPTAGTVAFQLFGNHWAFASGHTIQLELSQTDAPFLRPNNQASTVTWSSPELRLPTARR